MWIIFYWFLYAESDTTRIKKNSKTKISTANKAASHFMMLLEIHLFR